MRQLDNYQVKLGCSNSVLVIHLVQELRTVNLTINKNRLQSIFIEYNSKAGSLGGVILATR